MKLKYRVILLALILGAVFGAPQRVSAQQGDTLVVEWFDVNNQDVIRDALYNAVTSDVNRPPGRVYLLRKGGYYWNRETIQNNGYHLRIVGEPAGSTAEENPPVLQMVRRDDGSVNQRMITGVSSITLKNLWITGADDVGAQSAYQPIQIDADSSRFVIDNCIIDRSNFSVIAYTANDNDIFYTNNTFRNLIGRPSTQQWEGRGVSVWADQDTVVVENNTFFNLEFTAFQMEGGAIKYLRFNHNTMVNIGRNFLTGSWWREAYFANNLIVNGFWQGEGPNDYNAAGRDPRGYHAGMMGIGTLPSKYGPEEGRRILLANTASWRDPVFTTYYGTDVRAQPFVGTVTRLDYLSGQYQSIVVKDTTWLSTRPNFPTYPDTLLPKMWANITDLRAGTTPATPWFFELPTYDDGTECFQCISWPLPENFTYTDPQLLTAGTDGLPLGDLNWFPAQKAQFEANKAQYIEQLQALAGERLDVVVEETAEAEDGTLGGDATIEPYGGATPYFHMEGGGYIRWTFNMPQAGTIELKIVTRSQDARRGQHVRVNGTGLRNDAGFGEYSWYDLDPTEWKTYTIRQADLVDGTGAALDVQAGENTIEIAPSWGWQEFESVTVVLGGTDIVTLNATNVTQFDIVTLVTPVVLPWFHMEGGGYIRWTFSMAEAATVELRITTRSQDARRGQHVRVNGTGLRNDAGFGEYSWYDLDPEEWKAYTIRQADLIEGGAALNLAAGDNTIEIAPSWGWQEFRQVEVLVNGAVVHDLNATNVTEYDIVTIQSPGGLPPSSGFNSVLTGANGSITWTFNVPETGNYRLNVFHYTPNAQPGSVQVGGTTVTSFQYTAAGEDEVWRSVLTGKFALSAGAQAITLNGSNVNIDYVQFLHDITVTSVEDERLPQGYALHQNYPNPFNPTTTISFSLGKPSPVKLTVYNLLGQKVATVIDRPMSAGQHAVVFDAKQYGSGMYFYQLEAGDFKSHKRMMLIK